VWRTLSGCEAVYVGLGVTVRVQGSGFGCEDLHLGLGNGSDSGYVVGFGLGGFILSLSIWVLVRPRGESMEE
jgi:hypothetical protein